MQNNILVTFDSIYDVDLGLINLVKEKFNNNTYIDKEFLDKVEPDILVYLLATRNEENPLSIVINEPYMNQIDSLRNQFYDEMYDKILELGKPNNICELMKTYILTNQVSINILCKNIKEEQIINKIFKSKINIIVNDKYSEVDLELYDCIFVKHYRDILKFKNLRVKNIYVVNYKFNFDKGTNTLIEEVSNKIAQSNMINCIDAYDTNLNALG